MSNLLDKASIVLTPTAYDNSKVLCVKPSDGSGDFDFSRNSAATRVNAQGLVENVQTLSSNLVQNGDFSQQGVELGDTGIITNNNGGIITQIVGTSYNATSDGTSTASTRPRLNSFDLTAGKFYKITITPTNQSGDIKFTINNDGSTLVSYNDLSTGLEFYFLNGSNFRMFFDGRDAFNCDFEISLKEVGQNWIIEDTWTIGDGVANGNGANGTSEEFVQSGITTNGKTYILKYEVKNYVSGSIKTRGGASPSRAANGVYTATMIANGPLTFVGSNFNGSITNISLIEITDDTNLPRISYDGFSFDGSGDIISGSGCGHWLWENQSTNLITYSEDFSQWSLNGGGSLVANSVISPDGTQNASSWTTNNTGQKLQKNTSGFTQGNEYTFSIYIKADTNLNVGIGGIASPVISMSVTTQWQRFEVTQIANGTTRYPQLQNIGDNGTFYIWGAQVEEQSYATSYIPTDGTSVTRNQDDCTNGGSVSTISSTSGVLYAEISALANENLQRVLSISDGTHNNCVKLGILNSATAYKIFANIRLAGVNQAFLAADFGAVAPTFKKCAIKYKENDFALWIDGVEVATDTSGNTFSENTLNSLQFDRGNGIQDFYGKTKALAVWKEALSDEELAELTTI